MRLSTGSHKVLFHSYQSICFVEGDIFLLTICESQLITTAVEDLNRNTPPEKGVRLWK